MRLAFRSPLRFVTAPTAGRSSRFERQRRESGSGGGPARVRVQTLKIICERAPHPNAFPSLRAVQAFDRPSVGAVTAQILVRAECSLV
jgi:hypothetical protein